MSGRLNFGVFLVLTYISTCVCVDQPQPVAGGQEAVIKSLFLDNPALAEANKIARPPGTDSPLGAVKVTLGYSGVSITSFDEINGDISLKVWEQSFWNDTRLKWSTDDYPGVTKIFIPSRYIWLPDITVYSSGTKDRNSDWGEETAVVNPSGQIFFIPVRTITFRCSMDITNFPFDTQTCSVSLGSWVHHKGELEITNNGIDWSNTDNSHIDWKIVSHNLSTTELYYPCCPESYQTLTLTLVLSRRYQFYVSIFVAPAVVMFFILPAIHLFPPGSSQKTTIAGLLLVCVLLLHFMIYQQIRGFADAKAPKLVEHYQSLMTMIVVSIGVSSLTSTLANAVHTSRRVPAAIRKVMNSAVGRICCFRSADVKGEFTQLIDAPINIQYDPQHDMAPIVDDSTAETNNQAQNNSTLHYLTADLRYSRERRQLEMEWYQLALFIDRLALVCFALYVIIGIGIMKGH